MPVPTLIIGLGGTGLKALLMIKERLIEAYGKVPSEVRLLEMDTDEYPVDPTRDNFNGIKLTTYDTHKWNSATHQYELVGLDDIEFYHIKTKTENQLISDDVLSQTGMEWKFIDKARINKTITAADQTKITDGARTVRPLSKLALYMDYQDTVAKIDRHIDWLKEFDRRDEKTARGRVFVLGSAAGGSGAGLVVDILKLLGTLLGEAKALPTSCLLAGGRNFARRADSSRTFSNTYAVLREVERLGAMSGLQLPRIVPARFYAPGSEMKNVYSPASEVLVFDYKDRLNQDRVPGDGSYLDQVVIPSMADYVVTLMDTGVSTQMSSFKADFESVFPKEQKRQYSYFGIGMHSLIFPERDVRKTAGFKLLREIWADCLVRDVALENRDPSGSDLDVPTNSLVEEHKKLYNDKLVPYVLAQIGFQRNTVLGDVLNNPFIKLVATSSVKGSIQVPSGFWDSLLRRPILERIFNLIGAPAKSGTVDETVMQEKSENFAKVFDDTIEKLASYTKRDEVDNWRLLNWGSRGAIGSEEMDRGEWMKIIRNDPYIQGHKSEFMVVLGQVVKAILNDQGPEGILSYRLEYAHRVLDELERLTKRWIQADDDGKAALLSEAKWFRDDFSEFQKKAEKAKKAKDGDYPSAVEFAAKARRNLVAYYLLEELCNLLLSAINTWQKELLEWRTHLRNAFSFVQTEESKHAANRRVKANIKARTYVTNDEFENRLYAENKARPKKDFLGKVKWTYQIGKETTTIYDNVANRQEQIEQQVPVIWLEDSVFAKSVLDNPRWNIEYRKEVQEKLRLTAEELAARAINWACTDTGNDNRPDAGAAFANLGNIDQVRMGDRICDHFGAGEGVRVADKLTDVKEIAALCPLNKWPNSKMIYLSCIPMHDTTNDDRRGNFYKTLDRQLKNNAMRYDKNRPYMFNYEAENKRLAFGMEMAVLWQLKNLGETYELYAKSYNDDDNAGQALHCLPEEKLAAQVYEVAINQRPTKEGQPKNEIFGDLGITQKIRLVPEVVDILIDRERLELFAKAVACKLINNVYGQNEKLIDWYLYPGSNPLTRYRLSKMETNDEIETVLSDLLPNGDERTAVLSTPGDKTLVRARFWYALRVFMLGEADLDDSNRAIPYKGLKAEVDKHFAGKNPSDVCEIFKKQIETFKNWYLDYKDANDNRIVLAHLGLLLMAVANDLNRNNNNV